MKNQRKTEIRVGITVILGILCLIFVLSWAKNISLTSNQKNINVKFSSASGLEVGDNVTVFGIRKGFVSSTNVENDGVLVSISLNNDVELKDDAKFSIVMLDLMGGKKIDINPGSSNKPIDYSLIQKGNYIADIPEVMAILGSVQNDLINIIKEVQTTLVSVNEVLTDKDFNNNIKVTAFNLTEITLKLNSMIDENRTDFKKITSTTADLLEETSSFLKENKTSTTEALKELNEVLKNTNEILAKAEEFITETKEQRNNAGKLLYDEKFLEDINKTLSDVKELTSILIEQLKGKGINIDAKIKLF